MNFFQNLSEMIARLLQGLFAQNSTPTSTVEESPQQPSVTDDTTTEAGQTHPQRPAIEPPPSSQDALSTEEIPPAATADASVSTSTTPAAPASEQPLPGEIDSGQIPAVITVRVKLLVFNPKMPDGRTLIDTLHFNDPEQMSQGMITDLKQVSNGCLSYEIVERQTLDALPKKGDGFTYTPQAYAETYRARLGFHEPDAVDYTALLQGHNLIQGIQSDAYDEIWLFAPPYSGFYESVMGGTGAFYCNAPPLAGTAAVPRRFFLMGFNYERGVGEMLENMGHRAEFTMLQVYRRRLGIANLWQRFTRIDMTNPGKAEVGSVHFAPNSLKDYEWNSLRMVPSRCDTWYNFPNLDGDPRLVDCTEWGGGDIRLHHLWWFKHFPHRTGQVDGISANWWRYVANPNFVR
jgi:hypothetical protein